MTDRQPLRVLGSVGSPYTRKLIALLRYRRIAHAVSWGDPREPPLGLPAPRVPLLPTCWFTDATGAVETVTDSTPIIRRLEREHGERSVLPPDAVLGFLASLVEDFADEWLTKAMFHYRWRYAPDAEQASTLIPLWRDTSMPAGELQRARRLFGERQVGRLGLVGSNARTGQVIEQGYERLLGVLGGVFARQRFLFGARPSCADFALYGQLTQLARIDPTPAALAYRIAPRLCAWVDTVEDLSGLEPSEADWLEREAAGAGLRELLGEIGRVYAPFLLANAAALAAGEPGVECEIDGSRWTQPSFPYQGKCLAAIRAEHAALEPAARESCQRVLAGTGCEALLA